jgi:hypothetical protein
MITLVVLALVGLVAFVAYKLFKKGKAVTVGNVVAGVESTVSTAATDVKTDVTK